MFISAVDTTIVNVALPEISRDLHAAESELQWVMDSFLIALGGFLLVGSGSADRFGRKRVFLSGFTAFALASVLAAVSATAQELIVARVLMGLAATCVLPPALALLAVMFEPAERARALGIWSGVAGLGIALGPVIGGVLVAQVGWPAVFLVNVPVAVLAVPPGLALLPESRRPGVPPLDLGGLALSVVALTGIAFSLIEGADNGLASPPVIAAGVVGVLAAAAFVRIERRGAHPLFDVRVLARRRVAAGAIGIFCVYGAFCAVLFLVPQYLEYVQDRSPSTTGLLLLPAGLGVVATGPLAGRLLGRIGDRRLIPAGLVGMALGCGMLATLDAESSVVRVCLAMLLLGGGLGLCLGPATAVIMNDLGLDQAGEAAATNQLSRQVGAAMGIAVVGSVFAAVYAARVDDRVHGVTGSALEAVRDSIEGAVRVGATLPPGARAQLLVAADAGFAAAARIGFVVCAGALLVAALVNAVGLARRALAPAATAA
jgi:EmrB/QacA subfamily drug resistance transporter